MPITGADMSMDKAWSAVQMECFGRRLEDESRMVSRNVSRFMKRSIEDARPEVREALKLSRSCEDARSIMIDRQQNLPFTKSRCMPGLHVWQQLALMPIPAYMGAPAASLHVSCFRRHLSQVTMAQNVRYGSATRTFTDEALLGAHRIARGLARCRSSLAHLGSCSTKV